MLTKSLAGLEEQTGAPWMTPEPHGMTTLPEKLLLTPSGRWGIRKLPLELLHSGTCRQSLPLNTMILATNHHRLKKILPMIARRKSRTYLPPYFHLLKLVWESDWLNDTQHHSSKRGWRISVLDLLASAAQEGMLEGRWNSCGGPVPVSLRRSSTRVQRLMWPRSLNERGYSGSHWIYHPLSSIA